MNFLGCDEIFFLRFLPSGGRFEESKYRWRRQEKRVGEQQTNCRPQFLSSLRINKMHIKREGGKEAFFMRMSCRVMLMKKLENSIVELES